MEKPTQDVVDYYHTRESRWGYQTVLHGIKHFGYYPQGHEDISMSEAVENMMEQVGSRLNLPSGSHVLDAGCGEGATAIHLAQSRRYDIEGVDILDFNIARGKLRAKENGATVNFTQASYDKLPFGDNSFDGIYTLETLLHAPDVESALKEFKRVLKPGGKLVMFEYTMPEISEMDPRQQRIFRTIAEGSAMHSFLSFTHGSFPKRLDDAGFRDVKVEDLTDRMVPMLKRFHRLGIVPYQIIKLLGKQKQFVNTTSGVELYRYRDIFRYNAITANKSKA
jgi:ubiquinone/menaquinone biosynthesis C-methylase UbiE